VIHASRVVIAHSGAIGPVSGNLDVDTESTIGVTNGSKWNQCLDGRQSDEWHQELIYCGSRIISGIYAKCPCARCVTSIRSQQHHAFNDVSIQAIRYGSRAASDQNERAGIIGRGYRGRSNFVRKNSIWNENSRRSDLRISYNHRCRWRITAAVGKVWRLVKLLLQQIDLVRLEAEEEAGCVWQDEVGNADADGEEDQRRRNPRDWSANPP